ncbi:MAG: iron-containing alcohol dehydrogenase [Oscillospiraceae bacterium]|jgi:alcohol dehydrogenase class IV|nr:iron-containing alcohol dehydrogenase [Oscillospiraceae bacterium]
MSDAFRTAKDILYGENALSGSVPKLAAFGKKAFIVTGKHVSKLGIFKGFLSSLENAGTRVHVFDGITGEPTGDMVELGAGEYRRCGADFLIGFGGGSPIDAMKAIAAVPRLNGEIAAMPKTAAIPTTAGTGSEVTKFAVITDSATDTKMLLKDELLIPDLAVVDPACTVSSPSSVTASAALDALTHAAEAYTSRKAQPLTDTLALSAVRRIFTYLPKAYQNGCDLSARHELSLAALEAGMCINNSSVTLVHGMSRPIGALFHVPHGVSNAMLLPACMAFAADGAYGRFAALGRTIGLTGDNDAAVSRAFAAALQTLCADCGIPSLESFGVPKEIFFTKIDKMSDDALASGSPANTVKTVTKGDILALYRSLWPSPVH